MRRVLFLFILSAASVVRGQEPLFGESAITVVDESSPPHSILVIVDGHVQRLTTQNPGSPGPAPTPDPRPAPTPDPRPAPTPAPLPSTPEAQAAGNFFSSYAASFRWVAAGIREGRINGKNDAIAAQKTVRDPAGLGFAKLVDSMVDPTLDNQGAWKNREASAKVYDQIADAIESLLPRSTRATGK